MARQLTEEINQNFETEMKVEGVSVGFDGAVNLASFFIADHHADTLFYAKNFKTDLYSLRQWVNGNLFFSTTEFEDLLVKIVKYEGEKNNSFFQFTNKLLAHVQPKKDRPGLVRIDQLNIIDGQFIILDSSDSQKPLQFQNIKLKAKDFFVVNQGLEVAISHLKLDSKDYGKLNFQDTNFYYDPCAININSLNLSNGDSQLEGDLNFLLPEPNFTSFKDNAFIEFDLNGTVAKEQLQNFIALPDSLQLVKIQLTAQGNLKDIDFSLLEINQDVMQLVAKLRLKNAFSPSPIKVDLDLQSLNLNIAQLAHILPKKYLEQIPKNIFNEQLIKGNGSLSFENEELTTNLTLYGRGSRIDNQSLFHLEQKKGKYQLNRFEVISAIEKLDLSSWHPKFGSISSQLSLSGYRGIDDIFNLDFDINVDEIQLATHLIKNIGIKGDLNDKLLKARMTVDNQHISADGALALSWENPQGKYQFDINLKKLNLHHFDADLGGGKAIYSGDLNLFMVGNTFDDLQGNLLFKNIQFQNQSKRDSFNDFILETSFTDKKRTIRTINSEIMDIKIEGEFQLSKLTHLFSNAIAEAFPFVQKKKIDKKQDLIYDVSIQTDHLNAIFPALVFDKKAVFRGILSTEDKVSKMTLNIPKIVFKGIDTENIELLLDNQNPLFNTFLSVGKIEGSSYEISNFNSLGIKKLDTLKFRTEFSGKNEHYEFNYQLSVNDQKSQLLFNPSIIKVENNFWTLNPKGDKKHLISFDMVTKEVALGLLVAESGDERIEVEGTYQSQNNFGVSLNMDKVLLQNLAISGKKFDPMGAIDLSLDIQRSLTDNTLKFNGSIEDFILNDLEMGSLRFFTSGNTQLNSYKVNLLLSHKEKETMSVNGSILSFDQIPRLDLDFKFDTFDLSFLTPLGGEGIGDIRGNVNGNVNLWGPIDNTNHMGELILNEGGLEVLNINTDYRLTDGTKVTLVDQVFKFNNTSFKDIRYGTQASLDGEISHVNFSDWRYDLNILSDRILMLNIPEGEDEVFFGDGFLEGKVHLYGPSKNLTIDVVGSTGEGTSIKIPWAKDYGLADTSFIKFIDKTKNINTKQQSIVDAYNFSGLQMNFELDVNNNAEIKVVIDKESGSFLSGRGAGNILMEIDTKGKFNMWGDFITYDGIYNFKNLGVIDKKFNLKQGGTIVWEGDPLGAQMDLEAIYDVPGGANPALLLDNPNFNRKIPTEVLIRLQGNLLKPDDPIFEIDFPNTSAVFTSEINYRLADPQISQLQAISLLSQGIFINEVSVSVQGITNNLYEKASDLFSNLLGDDQGKLQVGVNYLQGDRNKVLDVNSEDRLGLTLSTQITDKILLNGNIGVPVGGIEETLIVGDLQIDFILNEEGSLKAKVFNKENEFRYIGDELGYTQGVGLSYQVDFDTFSELLNKIIKGSQSSEVFQDRSPVSDPSDVGINFINKK